MWDKLDSVIIAVILLIGLIFLAPLVFEAGVNEGRTRTERRAVTVGLAIYTYEEDGRPKFMWLSPAQIEANPK